MRKHFPNILTCCNLLCGCLAVYCGVRGVFFCALLFILCGAVFDFFDGFSARLLGVSSPIGKELDSLADVVTFGFAPSTMLYSFLSPLLGYWALLALLMVAFSALRLAKFNVDERQTKSFIGLATPPNAIFWASLTAVPTAVVPINAALACLLLAMSFVSCYLLVSEIPFFSFKAHNNRIVMRLFWGGCACLVGALAIVAYSNNAVLLTYSGAACITWYVICNFLNNNILTQ